MVYRLLGLLLKFFFVLPFIGNAKHGNLPSLTLTGRFLEKHFGYLLEPTSNPRIAMVSGTLALPVFY